MSGLVTDDGLSVVSCQARYQWPELSRVTHGEVEQGIKVVIGLIQLSASINAVSEVNASSDRVDVSFTLDAPPVFPLTVISGLWAH